MLVASNTYLHPSITIWVIRICVPKGCKLEPRIPVDEAGALVETGTHRKFLIEEIRKTKLEAVRSVHRGKVESEEMSCISHKIKYVSAQVINEEDFFF